MDPAQVVQEQVDAYNARDLEGFVSYYSTDAFLLPRPFASIQATESV